jgi:hypothetical protein
VDSIEWLFQGISNQEIEIDPEGDIFYFDDRVLNIQYSIPKSHLNSSANHS